MQQIHLILILLFLTCSYTPEQPNTGIIPDFVIYDNEYYRWFRDSTLNDFITPKEWENDTADTGNGIIVVIHEGNPDYTETEFPDTFWGVYYSYFFPGETLSCVKFDCEKINDTVLYDYKWYFDSLEIEFLSYISNSEGNTSNNN
ncbi:MAG: hypothetical protein GY853_00925 [PVC group bacterium]|nr:hypothetical protein [PVC group bacterium]